MTRARSAAGYWLNHVALTTDMRVREKSRTLYFFPWNKERVKQKEKEAKTTERKREKWPQTVLKPRMKEKNERVKQERRGYERMTERMSRDDVILFPHQWGWLDGGEALAVFIVVSLSSFQRGRSQVRPVVPMRKVVTDIMMILRKKHTDKISQGFGVTT